MEDIVQPVKMLCSRIVAGEYNVRRRQIGVYNVVCVQNYAG